MYVMYVISLCTTVASLNTLLLLFAAPISGILEQFDSNVEGIRTATAQLSSVEALGSDSDSEEMQLFVVTRNLLWRSKFVTCPPLVTCILLFLLTCRKCCCLICCSIGFHWLVAKAR